MKIGVPKETKNFEFRVGLLPEAVKTLVQRGHEVFVQRNAGIGAGYADEDYQEKGAVIVAERAKIYESAQLIVKIKAPIDEEISLLTSEHIVCGYLHLAANQTLFESLMTSGCSVFAFDALQTLQGNFPLRMPMSEIAGRMAVQVGAHFLEKSYGGKGILLGGVAGIKAAQVIILGAGVVGQNAVRTAVGHGGEVSVIDPDLEKLRQLEVLYQGKVRTLGAQCVNIGALCQDADLVIGAASLPGVSAPRLLSRREIGELQPGTVLVDVSIDEGGCFESSRPTAHDNPTFSEQGIIHYCVPNMPGAVPRSATQALNNVLLPWMVQLAEIPLNKLPNTSFEMASALSLIKGQPARSQLDGPGQMASRSFAHTFRKDNVCAF